MQEPRQLSIIDLLALVAGFALAWSLPEPASPLPTPYAYAPTLPGRVFDAVQAVLASILLALALVILARRCRYGGPPHPAEWLALALAMVGVEPRLSSWTSPLFWGLLGLTDGPLGVGGVLVYWDMEGLLTFVFLAALTAVLARWGSLPGWARTPSLVALSVLLLAGPIREASLRLDDVLPYRHVRFQAEWLSCLVGARWNMLDLPWGLFLGIPAVATLRDLRSGRSGRAWTEWAGLSAAGLVAAAWLSFRGYGVVKGWAISGAWSLGYFLRDMIFLILPPALLSRWVVQRCGDAATRWYGLRSTPAQSPVS